MTCTAVIAEVETCCDGELSYDRQEAVLRHVEGCPKCTERYRDHKLYRDMMRQKLARHCCNTQLLEAVRNTVVGAEESVEKPRLD